MAFEGYGFDSSREQFPIIRCQSCGLGRIEPTPTAAELQKYYQTDYYGSAEQKFTGPLERFVLAAQEARARSLIALYEKQNAKENRASPPKVLDVGCGRGLFLRAMSARGWQGVGTELGGFPFGQPPQGIQFLHGSVETLPLEPESFDAATIWHVLEHTLDPSATLDALTRAVRPGGVLWVAVPNFDSVQSRLFGKHWLHLDLPRHVFHFGSKSLRQALEARGWVVDSIRTLSWEQNLSGFVQSFLNTLFWKNRPNGLFNMIKRQVKEKGNTSIKDWVLFGALALLSSPLAMVEATVTAVTGNGASLIIAAHRPRSQSGH